VQAVFRLAQPNPWPTPSKKGNNTHFLYKTKEASGNLFCMVGILQREQAYYDHELPHLLAEHGEGKWVLIFHERLAEVFDTQEDALRAGHLLFGLQAFFVKQIVAPK
jgi:hypothetical protein